MRQAFIQALIQEAKKDKRIMLLTGDVGYTVLEEFVRTFPDSFLNCGVAEANMVAVAAGLAKEGFIPFVYSIAPFVTLRPLEQIRNDVCFHNLLVKIVGIGGGLAYGHAGSTHHTLEDIAVMRALANMTVIVPADPVETRLAVAAITRYPGPVYLRLGKSGEITVHKKRPNFHIGRGIVLSEESEIALIACGSMVYISLEIKRLLEDAGLKATVVSMHTVKPVDEKLIKVLSQKHKLIVTVEEHSVIGGLGSAVAEIIAGLRFKVPLHRVGISDHYVTGIGSQKHLRDSDELTAEKITATLRSLLRQHAKTIPNSSHS